MKKDDITEVVILYNPNSTGDSLKNARQLRQDLRNAQFSLPISLVGTKYRRHAEKLATKYAAQNQPILLISSSGDGGYHELINGVLAQKSSKIITGLLPSGNANDHYRAMSETPIVEQILHNEPRVVDVIRVTATVNGKEWVRYAHSYVGIGISPVIGRELNKKELNIFNEKFILLKELLVFKNVRIKQKGRTQKITSLICTNISQMSKALKIAKDSSPNDGKFEVTIITPGSRFAIISALFKAVTLGLEEKQSVSEYSFETIKRLPIQLDGEIYMIDNQSKVTIQILHRGLSIII
jgi:diacylglycerol kinase (ATP)